MTKNRLSFAASQTLLASENEFTSTGNFNSAETVGDARRLINVHRMSLTVKNLYLHCCSVQQFSLRLIKSNLPISSANNANEKKRKITKILQSLSLS